MPTSKNRTNWPINGGAVAFQPGWFSGHKTAFIYINLGLGTVPENMNNAMVKPFQLVGPTADPYPGTFCIPQMPLPKDAEVKIGDNATIQLVETAVHGAALYNVSDILFPAPLSHPSADIPIYLQCVDITFADPSEVAEVNTSNCFNSSSFSMNHIYATNDTSSAYPVRAGATSSIPLSLLLAGLFAFLL